MKFFSLRLFSQFFLISATLLNASTGLDYLNTLRTKAGVVVFTEETHLNDSSQNHSDYMQTNSIAGHDENSADAGYTGVSPSDRALFAGYQHKMVSENISAGQSSVKNSIDGLMSAIYHRFGFLSMEYDEVGIGISDNGKYYTYDMGNSSLNALCTNEVYTGGNYYLPCADDTVKVESAAYEGRADTIKEASSDLIRWPSVGSSDIPPVFYEEIPDPLPSDGVTAYPVSVEFNRGYFTTAPIVDSFSLKDADGITLNTLISMNHENDPNGRFTAYQFALFSKQRLEWGSVYSVDLAYSYEDTAYEENWCFSTRSLYNVTDRFYRIENSANITLQAISGKSYAIYLVPNNTNDTLGPVRYSDGVSEFSYIDANTVAVTVTGSIGKDITLSFGNGQEVKLTIDSVDTAAIPANTTCAQITDTDSDGITDSEDLDDDNDGYSDVDEIAAGSDSLDSNDTPLDTDRDMIPNFRDTDDDGDGISDIVERMNRLNPLDASDAQADFDSDGFSNSIEISVGSDLRSAASHPTWTPVMMDDVFVLIPSFP